MAEIIVVGVDGSATALQAAQTAARLAAGMDANLHVVIAYEAGPVEVMHIGSDTLVISDADEAERIAEKTIGQLRSITSNISSGAVPGKPHEVLISEAERLQAKLIVVGNRRMQGLGRVLGSVANTVAHNAPCDVYIAKTV